MSVFARITSALGANAFGQAVTIGSQLALTPLFFRVWGAGQYGEWLLLSSVPAYLMMADVGIGSAAGNEMTMSAGAGDQRAAQNTFLSALAVALGASLLALLVGALTAWLLWQSALLPLLHIPAQDAALISLALSAIVGLGFFGSVLSAGFRCCGRNALGIMLSNTGRLFDAVTIGALLLAQQTPITISVVVLALRLLILLGQAAMLLRVCPWLFNGGGSAKFQVVRQLIRPAVGFMAFPLGDALALQGPLLVIGSVFGGAGVAMFSSLRTLARVPVQLTNMFNSSIWPELSRAHGAGNLNLMRKLHRASWGLNLLLVAPLAAVLIAVGPWVVRLWLGAEAPFDPWVLAALIVVSVISAVWHASSVVLVAINHHLQLGAIYVTANAVCLSAAAIFTSSLHWVGLFAPLLTAELALLVWVLPRVLRITDDSMTAFFPAIADETMGSLQRSLRRRV